MAILLTEPEAARELSLSTRTLRKFRQKGDLDYHRIGGAIRYSVEDLRSFAEGHRICGYIEEKTHHSTGAASPQKVIDFAKAQKKRASAKPK